VEAIEEKVRLGIDIWGRKHEQSFTIGPADDLPYTVLRDLQKYTPHFAEGWRPEFHEDWYSGDQALYMAQIARSAPKGAIVEIGCWEGKSTVVLAQMVAPRVVHCVDHWQGNADEGEGHPATVAAAERDVLAQFMRNTYLLTNQNTLTERADWRDWIKEWDEGHESNGLWRDYPGIAFLHLDAAHDRASVRDCLTAIKPFLVPGAILCGDDAYDERVRAGVADVFPDAEIVNQRLWKVVYRND
jgi:hypothetical protein